MAEEPLAVRIAARIAAHEGADPTALDPPLHEVVDLEALEALFDRPVGRPEFTGTVSFEYREYTVTVDHTDAVSVTSELTADTRGDAPRTTDVRSERATLGRDQ